MSSAALTNSARRWRYSLTRGKGSTVSVGNLESGGASSALTSARSAAPLATGCSVMTSSMALPARVAFNFPHSGLRRTGSPMIVVRSTLSPASSWTLPISQAACRLTASRTSFPGLRRVRCVVPMRRGRGEATDGLTDGEPEPRRG